MEELYINNERVDIFPKKIALNLQINDIGDLNSRQASYTNVFDLPKTANNMRILNMIGSLGGSNNGFNNFYSADLFLIGIQIIKDGFVKIRDLKKDRISINITFNNFHLIRMSNEIRLNQLDYGNIYNTLIGGTFANHDNTSNLVEPIIGLKIGDDLQFTFIAPDYVAHLNNRLPLIYAKDLWDKIFNYMNLGYEGDIFTDADFTNKVYSFTDYDHYTTNSQDETIVSTNLVKEFIQEICIVFGLVFQEKDRVVTFKNLSDIFEGDSDDWSDKFISESSRKFKENFFAQVNKIENNYHDEGNRLDYEFIIDNYNLKSEKTVLKPKSKRFSELTELDTSLFVESYPTTYNPDSVSHWKRGFKENSLFTITQDSNYKFAENQFNPAASYKTPAFFATTEGLDGESIIKNYYPNVVKSASNSIVVEIYVNLSILDILNIDFLKLKYFKQLGKCYLNRIKNFQLGKPTLCEFVVIDIDNDYDFDNQSLTIRPLAPTAELTSSSDEVFENVVSTPPYSGTFEYDILATDNISSDPNNQTLRYNWIKVSQPTEYSITPLDPESKGVKMSGSDPVGAGTLPGVYVVKLVVQNEDKLTDEFTFTLTVNP